MGPNFIYRWRVILAGCPKGILDGRFTSREVVEHWLTYITQLTVAESGKNLISYDGQSVWPARTDYTPTVLETKFTNLTKPKETVIGVRVVWKDVELEGKSPSCEADSEKATSNTASLDLRNLL